jgi:hypothetical protein
MSTNLVRYIAHCREAGVFSALDKTVVQALYGLAGFSLDEPMASVDSDRMTSDGELTGDFSGNVSSVVGVFPAVLKGKTFDEKERARKTKNAERRRRKRQNRRSRLSSEPVEVPGSVLGPVHGPMTWLEAGRADVLGFRERKLELERLRTEAAIRAREEKMEMERRRLVAYEKQVELHRVGQIHDQNVAEAKIKFENTRSQVYVRSMADKPNSGRVYVRSWRDSNMSHSIRSNCSEEEVRSALSARSAGLVPSDSVSNASSERKKKSPSSVSTVSTALKTREELEKHLLAMSHLERMQYFSKYDPKKAQRLYEMWCRSHNIEPQEW